MNHSENIEQLIVTEDNKDDFIKYVLSEIPNNICVDMYKVILEWEVNTFIETEKTWIESQHMINTIVQTQNIIASKPKKENQKNTRPTNRKEKANLLAQAAEKRMNKYSKKRRKK